MAAGATLIAPETVFLSFDTKIGRDVLIEPHVVIGPGVHDRGWRDDPRLLPSRGRAGRGGAVVGPFARLRPGARHRRQGQDRQFRRDQAVGDRGGRQGQSSDLHRRRARRRATPTSAPEPSPAITTASPSTSTDIGAGAFIGSNSALVAPVTIGDGAYVGSGSVITKDGRSRRAGGRARPAGGEGRLGQGVPGAAQERLRRRRRGGQRASRRVEQREHADQGDGERAQRDLRVHRSSAGPQAPGRSSRCAGRGRSG